MGIFNRRAKEKSAVDRVHASQIIGNAQNTPGLQDAYPYAQQTSLINPKQAANIYSQSPLAYTATHIVASLLANVPLNIYLYERNTSGKKTIKRTGYPYVMLNWVNPYLSTAQLIEYTASWLKLSGDAFWAIEETQKEYAGISLYSIYPLNPQFVRIVVDPDTGTKGYVYELGSDRQYYPDNRVLHFKSFSPHDYWHGHSELNPLTYDLQVEKYTKRQLRNFFAGGTVLDGVLSIEETLDDDEVRKLKREFREQHEGSRNAHRILVLTKGMQFTVPIPPAPSLSLAPLMDKTTENQSMVFGVPVGVMLGKGAELAEAKALMWEQTIQPLGKIIEDTVTKRLCLPISPRLESLFNYTNVASLRLKDLDRARVEVAHANTGISTVNDIRRARDWDEYPGEFANTPIPEWNAAQAVKLGEMQAASRAGTGSSPSLPLTGSQGGRDQSSSGEAQVLDESGQKDLTDLFGV